MGLTKPIEQYLFSNLLIRIHVFMYLKDIIRGGISVKNEFFTPNFVPAAQSLQVTERYGD